MNQSTIDFLDKLVSDDVPNAFLNSMLLRIKCANKSLRYAQQGEESIDPEADIVLAELPKILTAITQTGLEPLESNDNPFSNRFSSSHEYVNQSESNRVFLGVTLSSLLSDSNVFTKRKLMDPKIDSVDVYKLDTATDYEQQSLFSYRDLGNSYPESVTIFSSQISISNAGLESFYSLVKSAPGLIFGAPSDEKYRDSQDVDLLQQLKELMDAGFVSEKLIAEIYYGGFQVDTDLFAGRNIDLMHCFRSIKALTKQWKRPNFFSAALAVYLCKTRCPIWVGF